MTDFIRNTIKYIAIKINQSMCFHTYRFSHIAHNGYTMYSIYTCRKCKKNKIINEGM